MNHCSRPPRFNVEEWLKSIDIWDEKYDYVMHNEHWLTSKWEKDCEKCKASGRKPPILKTVSTNNSTATIVNSNANMILTTTTSNVTNSNNNITLDKVRPMMVSSVTNNNVTLDKMRVAPTEHTEPAKPEAATLNTAGSKPTPVTSDTFETPINATTSSPARNRLSMNSTNNDPTLKNDRTTDQPNNMDISPPPPGPPPVTIAMTPIAPANLSTKRNFVTPYTNTKSSGLVGNETFQRSTRQTTRRLANQAANQDLIDLNETFDLYRSALADTPQLADHQTPGKNQLILPEPNQQQDQQQQQQQQQGGLSSRIPKIPVRLSSAFGFGSNH